MTRKTLYALVGLGALVALRLSRRRRSHDAATHPGPMTPSTSDANPADADLGVPGENQEARLEEALQESFSGSDPVSIRIE
jgi:hypothetical protein